MKALRIVLIIVGLLTLIPSLIGLLVPWSAIVSWANYWGITLSEATEANITVYITRIGCVTFVWAGFLFLLAAADPVKYLTLTRSLAVASVCIGLTCILVGAKLGLPVVAFLIDGLFCLIAGGLIWTLTCPLKSQTQQDAPPVEPST